MCFESIVNQPTRGANRLDRVYDSEPCYESVKVVISAVKSDHKAVIVYSKTRKPTCRKKRQPRVFRKRSPTQHALLLQHIADLNIQFDNRQNVQNNFDKLYSTMLDLVDRFYPERSITVISSDPEFVSPDIKAFLR